MVSRDWARDLVAAVVKVVTRGSYKVLFVFDYVGLSSGGFQKAEALPNCHLPSVAGDCGWGGVTLFGSVAVV
jgi:hypothetical protein